MINVVYHRGKNKVTVDGHAQSGEAGHDLVCASATTLVYTLAAFYRNTSKARHSHKLVIDIKNGHAEVSCKPKEKQKGAILIVTDAICGGFEVLANSYPEYIAYNIEGI